jgi:hypothetical protein
LSLSIFPTDLFTSLKEQNPVRKFEQKVIPVRKEGAVVEKVMDASLLVEKIDTKRGPEINDLRGGIFYEILTLLEVSQSSVIDSSNVGSSSEGSTHPGTHESLSNPPSPCLVDKVEVRCLLPPSYAVCNVFVTKRSE